MSITRNVCKEVETMEDVIVALAAVQRKVKRVKKQLGDEIPDELYATLRLQFIRLSNTVEDLKLEIRSDFEDRAARIRLLRAQAKLMLKIALHQLNVLVPRLPCCDGDFQLRYGRLVWHSQRIPHTLPNLLC